MITHHWELLLVGFALVEAVFLPLFALQLRTGDATAVDAGWAVSLAFLAALYAALGPGCLAYRILSRSAPVLSSCASPRPLDRGRGPGQQPP